MQVRIFVVLIALWLCPLLADGTTSAIALGPGPYLFLDNFLIEQSSNVTRVINCPKRDLKEPVVNAKEDQNFQPYMTVLRDPKTEQFRIWYGVPVSGGQSHLAHMTGSDGIHWNRPHQVLEDPAPINFGASVLDEGPGFLDPERRYKFVWYHGGLMMAQSADGLKWTANPAHPVLKGINDITHLAKDTARNRYIAIFGFPSRPEDGYKGKPHHAPEGYRRCVGQSTSADCLKWSGPRRIIAPDDKDEGITEFYSAGGVITRGQTLVALLKVLRDDLPCDENGPVEGIGYTVLTWSHDGENWERDRLPFFDRNHDAKAWDHAMAWMDYQLPVGDEVYVYYGGYAHGHKVERFTERQIGLVRIKRDRYVALKAGEESALVRTRPIEARGERLTLNVDSSRGGVRVQVLGEDGKAIPGFGFVDCTPIKEDSLRAPVQWKRSFGELKGKAMRLEIRMREASLFALNVETEN